ncbi:MAG TPA: carboxymuconolactone decarboxylase family protein [Gammaproteobacteria bacterium]|nr:carboxymuconolactone decarboxylase family protein [Gammaproteobacteria bacterium]
MSTVVNTAAQDQELAAHRDFAEVSRSTARHLKFMRQEALFTDGVLPARLKTLAAALWSVSARCEPCIRFYMQKARELGATREEIGEMLAVASTMGGCVGETWAAKAFSTAKSNAADDACCEP